MSLEALARADWNRALEALDLAERTAAAWPNSAANRAYYAAFHAVTALFALDGRSFERHSAVQAAVHRDLVRPGLWAPELGALYSKLFELRSTGDYGGLVEVTSDDARLAAEWAGRIVRAVHERHPEMPLEMRTVPVP